MSVEGVGLALVGFGRLASEEIKRADPGGIRPCVCVKPSGIASDLKKT